MSNDRAFSSSNLKSSFLLGPRILPAPRTLPGLAHLLAPEEGQKHCKNTGFLAFFASWPAQEGPRRPQETPRGSKTLGKCVLKPSKHDFGAFFDPRWSNFALFLGLSSAVGKQKMLFGELHSLLFYPRTAESQGRKQTHRQQHLGPAKMVGPATTRGRRWFAPWASSINRRS